MKKGGIIWGLVLAACIAILVIPVTHEAFMHFLGIHPYLGGFGKFFVLASLGDFLGRRVTTGEWFIPKGVIWKACVWGFLGVCITLVFTVFMAGTEATMAKGMLPFAGSKIALPIFASFIMNVTFGPMLFIVHRMLDLFIDLKYEKKGGKVTVTELVERNDWMSVVKIGWLLCQFCFWFPIHSLVFMLPAQYRVLASAFLSIALGLLLALARKPKAADKSESAAA